MATYQYKPSYCLDVIQMGEEGKSDVQMSASLRIPHKVFLGWVGNPEYPEFREAFRLAETCAEAYWEDMGWKIAKGIIPKSSAANWAFIMKNRYRARYKDIVDQNLNAVDNVKTMTDAEVDKMLEVLTARKNDKPTDNSGTQQPE